MKHFDGMSKFRLLSLLALLLTAVTGTAWAQGSATTTYKVKMKAGTKDADKWTIASGTKSAKGDAADGLTGLSEKDAVTLTYTGRLKVKGVKATSDAAPAAGKTVDLSTLSGDYEAQNGDVLTGETTSNRVTIAAGATLGFIKLGDLNEIGGLMTGDDHLCHTLAVVHDEFFLRQVHQQHTHLATIVGVDGAGCIQHGDSLLQGQSATRSHLCLVTLGQCDKQPCRHQAALQWFQHDALRKVSTQVHASALRRGILWQGLVPLIDHFYLYHIS
jgi:hypothetical protein